MTGINSWCPLFCSPSPRDIEEVTKCHQNLPYDRLYAKYFVEREAYYHLRSFFLQNEEYTHLVLIPDDLVFTMEDVEQLKADLAAFDYPVLSGICNVDMDENKDKWSITENLPHPVRPLKRIDAKENKVRRWYGWRWYSWFTDKTLQEEKERQKSDIIRVQHSGFALQVIRRDIVDQIDFMTDAVENGIAESETSSVDIMFSNSCGKEGIPIYADTRVQTLHLRRSGPVDITLGDGQLWFIRPNHEKKVFRPKQAHVPKRTVSMFEQG